jgi:hypothetical protein
VVAKLQASNVAAKVELDWQGQYDAINIARRLMRHHPEVIKSCLHEFVLTAAPAIEQLRSCTSRNAIMLFQEMFVVLGRGVDKEVDEIVLKLLKKAADISTAGVCLVLSLHARQASHRWVVSAA